MRATWKGQISCGVLNVAVCLYGATEEKSIKFNQIHTCGSRISQHKYCPTCDRQVELSELGKGYEVSKGEFVVFQNGELDHLRLASVKSIQILEFMQEGVDPRQYKKSYFLAPDKGGDKAFTLLLAGMETIHAWAIAKLTMRDKEQLVLVRPYHGVLLLQTLFYSDELRNYEELLPKHMAISEKEAELSGMLVKAMLGDGDVSKYHDDYSQALEELIQAKMSGVVQVVEEVKAEPEGDLAAQLMASIQMAEAKA